MKKLNDFVEIKNSTDENSTHHEIHIDHEKAEKEGKKTLLEKYFDKINTDEMKKGNDTIYKDEKKSRLLIPRNVVELQTLINDLYTLFNS